MSASKFEVSFYESSDALDLRTQYEGCTCMYCHSMMSSNPTCFSVAKNMIFQNLNKTKYSDVPTPEGGFPLMN